jgi:Ni,Fe-hydrogenase III small subunit/NAD-dependent dihydropyrimidine dehydrogenase PreA subunit
MFDLLRLRYRHGRQAIGDLRAARPVETHRGFPVLDDEACAASCASGGAQCAAGCAQCAAVCPSDAITVRPLTLDLGACTFCGECERACSPGAIRFSNEHRLGCTRKERLAIAAGTVFGDWHAAAIESRREIRRLFGRSLKLRQVSAAGCNGCELELGACSNVNFDMGRFGIEFVASPRYADGIVVTGPVSRNMAPALRDTHLAVPDPKIVVAVGACAISGGVFAASEQLDRRFFDRVPVDLFIPGCPPHPLTVIDALLRFLGR